MGRNKKDIWRMNRKGDFQFSPLIRAAIVILVVVVIIFIWNSTAFAGIKAFLGFKIPGQDQKIEPLTNYDFYNSFVNQYQACKLSPFTECRCKITSLENRLPVGYAIELAENGGNVEISLVRFSVEYKDGKCQVNEGEKDTSVKSYTINNDELVAKVGLDAELKETGGKRYLVSEGFDERNKISIFATEKGEGKCLPGGGTYLEDYDAWPFTPFSNYVYKFSSMRTGFVTRRQVQDSSQWLTMQECTAPKNVVEANEKFESFVKEINDLNTGAESTKTIKLELPADYTLKQKDSELLLNYAYYSKQEIKKSATSLCSTNKDLPNGDYLLTRTRYDPGITCVQTS